MSVRPARTLALTGTLLLVLGTAACGGGDDPLTKDQLSDAALTIDNLGGEGWVEGEPDDDENEAPGCLAEVEKVDDLEELKTGSVEVSFEYGEIGIPGLRSEVISSEAGDDDFETAFDAVADVIEECHTIEETEDDGTSYTLELTTDDDRVDGADRQINVHGEGTVSTQGMNLEFSMEMSFVQVGVNGVSLMTVNMAGGEIDHEAYAQLAVERLAAVADGEEPSDDQGPEPTAPSFG